MAEISNNRRNVNNSLLIQPWLSYKPSGPDKPYLVKYLFDKSQCCYNVLLYDNRQLWLEDVCERKMFEEKCKTFNPNIEAEFSSLLERVEMTLSEALTSSSGVVMDNDQTCLQLTVRSKLHAGIPFVWTFSFSHASIQLLSQHVTNPLTIMVTELLRRQQELFHMLERKDREIQDYKDQGVIASRKHLETLHFDGTAYQNTSNINQDFLSMCSNSRGSLSFLTTQNVTELYRNVMINTQSSENNELDERLAGTLECGASALFDTVPVSGGAAESAMKSWANDKRIPESVVNDNIDGSTDGQQQTSEPVAMTTNSPEQAEQKRREELRHRLENENERKNKKKKRKINL